MATAAEPVAQPTMEPNLSPEPEVNPAVDPTAPLTWREKLKKNWLLNRLAVEAMMTDRIQRVRAANERLMEMTRLGTLGTADAVMPGDDDMAVNVGNETYNITNYPAPPATENPVVTPAGPAVPPDTKPATSGVPGWLTAALLGLTTLGAGAGGFALHEYFSRETVNVKDVQSNFEVLFYDKDGKPIIVPHISTRPTGK